VNGPVSDGLKLDPRRLLIFAAVVRAGTFSGAARSLHLSQPSVSRHVAALEAELGVQLVLRLRGGVRVTPTGDAVLARARSIAAELTRLNTDLKAILTLDAGNVRVAAFPTAATKLVAPAFAKLRADHPGLTTMLVEASHADAMTLLRDGDVDVAVVFEAYSDSVDASPGISQILLLREPFLVALPAWHPNSADLTVPLRLLRGEGWIIGSATKRPGVIERACLAAGFSPRIVARADHQPTIQALVAAGVGVTLIPNLVAGEARDDILLRPARPLSVGRKIIALTPETERRMPPIKRFLSEIQAVANALKG
jgi:DNA-binding transcriptional LysR family regulator